MNFTESKKRIDARHGQAAERYAFTIGRMLRDLAADNARDGGTFAGFLETARAAIEHAYLDGAMAEYDLARSEVRS